jgi:hypothetical protein
MANIYVRSTDGSDADNGSTWALAKATLAGASAVVAAGDTVWVSQNHSESSASPISLTWNGTKAAPVRILCGNDAAQPPTALATTAVIETTGNNAIAMASTVSDYIYMYGLHIRCGVGTIDSPLLLLNQTSDSQFYEECTFEIAATGQIADVGVSYNAFGETICKNCHFEFSNASQSILASECPMQIIGGSLLAGVTPTGVFHLDNSGSATVEGFDMSAVGAAMNLDDTALAGIQLQVSNCKLPASWSGSINSATLTSGSVCELSNSIADNGQYRYQRKSEFGIIDGEKTNVRTGGASDGVRSISWKMVSNADPEWNHQTLDTGEIVRWNETIGSPITATIEILHDSVTNMTNQQIWLKVQYLGTSGFPLSSFIDDSSGNYLSSAADQTSSSVAWTTTGLTNPNKQKLSVTFTPQEKGFFHAVVHMAMASKTVYVDPKLEIT